MTKTLLLSGALLISVGTNIYLSLSDEHAQKMSLMAQEIEILSENNARLSNRLTSLNEQYAILASQINRLTTNVAQTVSNTPVQLKPSEAEPEVQASLEVENESSEESHSTTNENSDFMAQFAQKKMEDANYDPTQSIGEQFDNQSIDFQWASSYEQNLNELFQTNEALANMPLKGVSCKETICKVAIYANDIDSFSVANNLAKSLATQSWRDPDASFVFDNQPTDGVINIFIGKDGNSFQL